MIDHVLVPLDGSALAESALEFGCQILAPNGKITLVTAIDMADLPVYGSRMFPVLRAGAADYEQIIQTVLPQAQGYLKQVAGRCLTRGYNVEYCAHIGDPALVIVEAAEQLNADAIVMCSHGRSGLNRWLFGSVTSKVLSMTSCPVMVVPGKHLAQTLEESSLTTNAG
jgi:nucleotide-binding universal stress UspA family protein